MFISEEDHLNNVILQVREVSKRFNNIKALDSVSFDIHESTVHCIVGENGAGKSTLIKILTGALRMTSGELYIGSSRYEPRGIQDAYHSGISVLYQELNVVDELTVEQNLTLGVEETKWGIIRQGERTRNISRVLHEIDPSIEPGEKVEKLSVGKKQIIEIAKAVASNAKIIIMDEPTAALSEEEAGKLLNIIRNLREQNVTVIYISHRLDEIFQIGDEVTVLRDGKLVKSCPIGEIGNKDELIRLMLGHVLVQNYVPNKIDLNHPVLQVRNLSNERLKNISFDVCEGEIVGFYGLVGAGKTETARAIFGADSYEGEILIDGRPVRVKSPSEAIMNGIAMVPEERRTQGLFMDLAIKDNIPVMNYKRISRWNIYSSKGLDELADRYIKELRIVTDTREKSVSLLSGGNQQKVVVAKCLNVDSKVILLDEPSRGVDIGAKEEIFGIIRNMSANGVAVLVFSSELPEILSLCDKIILLYNGEIKSVLKNSVDKPLDSERIMQVSTGGRDRYEED